MLKKCYFFISMIIFFSLLNCADSLFDQIATNNIVPEEETVPVVKSFEIEHAVVIKWEKDKGADEYILYRSTNPSAGYSVVYRGSDLAYTDSSVVDDTFYYYKLAKKRGNKEFDKSRYVCGVANDKRDDAKENNNDRGNAKEFNLAVETSMSLNISYYKDAYDNIVEDVDWFYVMLPSSTTLEIQVVGVNNLISNQDLILYVEDQSSNTVVFTNNYQIINNTSSRSASRFYFRISVNKNAFIDGDPSAIGGKVGLYRIDFKALSE